MEILKQFGINPVLLAAQVVNFLLLLFILKKFLYKPILKVLEERKKKIEESLKNAEEIGKRLLRVAEDEEERIQKASLEGEKIIKEAQLSAAQIIEDGKERAEHLSQRILNEGRVELQLEKERLQQEVRGDLGNILLLSLQKITGKMFSRKDQKQLIEQAVKHLRV